MLVRKWERRARLDEGDKAAIMALPFVRRTYEPSAYLVREGEPVRGHCSFVISGFAFRQKLTMQGARQILAIHMPGDVLDLQHLFLRQADHNVQALTQLKSAELDGASLKSLVRERPNVAEAMWVDGLVDASIFREWILNVGRRDARARIGHLLCEFAARADALGLGNGGRFHLPMTQEQIGDATGLTAVHVNRTLKALAAEGLITRDKGYLRFTNEGNIRAASDFSALYLHLDQTDAAVI
jgi:CRP-like cAMP-binding protein